MKKFLFITLCLCLSLLLFSQAPKFFDELGLTKEQKNKLEKINLDNQIKRQEFSLRFETKQLELKKLLLKEAEVDRNQVKKILEEISVIEVELKLLRFDADKEILNILNPDQQQKYKVMRLKVFEKFDKKGPENKKNMDKNFKK